MTSIATELPTEAVIRTWEGGPIKYRATFARGENGLTAPIHADFQIRIYASCARDAEECAQHYADINGVYLIAVNQVQ